jgi:hypothetical protein
MTRFRVWIRIALFIVTIGLLAIGLFGQRASWAVAGQDVERQTVPTRTPTPAPVTPTVPPPPPTNTSVPAAPTVTPTSTVVETTVVAVTSSPVVLPEAGSNIGVWNAGLILLLSGALLMLVSRRTRREGRR